MVENGVKAMRGEHWFGAFCEFIFKISGVGETVLAHFACGDHCAVDFIGIEPCVSAGCSMDG